jgi:hypothetical protein
MSTHSIYAIETIEQAILTMQHSLEEMKAAIKTIKNVNISSNVSNVSNLSDVSESMKPDIFTSYPHFGSHYPYFELSLEDIQENLVVENFKNQKLADKLFSKHENSSQNNLPIQESCQTSDKLHLIIVISNPCLYLRRYQLAKEFIDRTEGNKDVILYVVELAYQKQTFKITDSSNPRHLQLRSNIPIWHKENMINLAVRTLLPNEWNAMAWVDADIEFENVSWASDTLKILNGSCDIVQVFSHAVDMNHKKQTMNIFNSFGYQHSKGHQYVATGINYWHPGFAWACTRHAYEKMGGLYQLAILGSGDNIMALSFIRNGLRALHPKSSESYKKSVLDFQTSVKDLKLGYVPGVILHHFHGSKKNRKYMDRWKILVNHNYEPSRDLTVLPNGVLCPTKSCPKKMLAEIMTYFHERNEDEYYE